MISHFTMGLNVSLSLVPRPFLQCWRGVWGQDCQPVWLHHHVALTAILCKSLLTSSNLLWHLPSLVPRPPPLFGLHPVQHTQVVELPCIILNVNQKTKKQQKKKTGKAWEWGWHLPIHLLNKQCCSVKLSISASTSVCSVVLLDPLCCLFPLLFLLYGPWTKKKPNN